MPPATKRCNQHHDGSNGGACDSESPLQDLPGDLHELLLEKLSMKALVVISGTSHEWQAKVRKLGLKYKPFNARRELEAKDAKTKRRKKFMGAFRLWLRQPNIFSGLSKEAVALVVKPAPAWDDDPDGDGHNTLMHEQEDRLADHCKLLTHAPLEVIAFAACDMPADQRRFFFGQCCGEWRIECGRYIDAEGRPS